jgi:hypothetical protein
MHGVGLCDERPHTGTVVTGTEIRSGFRVSARNRDAVKVALGGAAVERMRPLGDGRGTTPGRVDRPAVTVGR